MVTYMIVFLSTLIAMIGLLIAFWTVVSTCRSIRQDRRNRDNQRGYDFAMVELKLYGVNWVVHIENRIDMSIAIGEYDDFDRGIRRALTDYREDQDEASV